MEVFRTPDERFERLPGYDFQPNYIDLSGDLAGLRMHRVDVGTGDPVLCLHGEPTWSFLYRTMIPAISEVARVVAPDLIGFGRSDKPTDRDWYSYDRHTDSVVQLIEQLDLNGVTLVVHDWGGPIGLRVAVENPDRIARLVILNTGVFRPGPNWPTPGFAAWRQYAVDTPDLPIGSLIQGATTTNLSDDVVAAYDAPFPTVDSKAGAAAFPLLVPMTAEDDGAATMIEVRGALERWDKPTLVAFSDADPIFPQRAGERLAERIPGAVDFVPISGGGHFLQEDRGDEIAAHVVRFLGA
ncbi:MAG TPA: haloalkane dehalogenase [Actinomycetota bacterium]|nr:haloalkane dehalogenase [Actinomycetota bacterium]